MAKKPNKTKAPVVKITFEPEHHSFEAPRYMSKGAAGVDLEYSGPTMYLKRNGIPNLVGTKMRMEIPEGYEGQVRPRSGMALKTGFTVLNAPGTVDSDYRGEIMVLLVSNHNKKVQIKSGDRIAQMVFSPVTQVSFDVSDSVSDTERGEGGFGSTDEKETSEEVLLFGEEEVIADNVDILMEGEE